MMMSTIQTSVDPSTTTRALINAATLAADRLKARVGHEAAGRQTARVSTHTGQRYTLYELAYVEAFDYHARKMGITAPGNLRAI